MAKSEKGRQENINGRRDCARVLYGENAAGELLLLVGNHNTSNNSGDDDQQEDKKAETDPSLFASGYSRFDRLVCVLDTRGRRQCGKERSLPEWRTLCWHPAQCRGLCFGCSLSTRPAERPTRSSVIARQPRNPGES